VGESADGGGSLLKGVVGDSGEGVGVQQRGRHAARGRRGAWLRPAGDAPAAACADGAPLFRQWRADAADAWAPAGGGRGSEERGVRGPARRNAEWAEPGGILVIFNYSKSISNEFMPF
jgi:hypothetical protein